VSAALRMLLRKPAAGGMADRLVRVKNYAAPANASSATVTFDEGTALDSTHLLVAIVHYSSAGRTLTASGWTNGPTGSGNGFSGAVFARQGDGSANSITVTTTIATQRFYVTLLAFSGYSSTTVLDGTSGLFTSVSSGTLSPASTPAGYGVCVAGVALSNASIGPAFGGYTINGTAYNNGNVRAGSGRKEYTGPGTYNASPSWGSTTSGLWLHAIYPLV